MEITMNGEVVAKDGSYGRLTGLVIQPNTHHVTHLVFGKNERSKDQHIAPIQNIAQSNNKSIRLSVRKEDIELMTSIADQHILLKSDVRVKGTDGNMGHLHKLVITPSTGHISSIIIDTGGLFKKHAYLTLPAEVVSKIETDTFYVNTNKESFVREKTPA